MRRAVIEEEWRDSDGYWIALRPGWCDDSNPQCHTISENTKREAHAHVAVRCPCADCAKILTAAPA